MKPTTTQTHFADLPLHQSVKNTLEVMNFYHPTPIQEKTIPIAIEGADVLGIAQTGTGKTLAFGLPILNRLHSSKEEKALILVPTRELAQQVYDMLKKLSTPMHLSCAFLIGGDSMFKQIQQLRANPRIIVATPGRLNDHLQQKNLKLDRVAILVLDEADRMLDMGFMPQIREIMKYVPTERQTLLFSATMPKPLVSLAHSLMKNPQRIEVAPQGSTVELINQEAYMANKSDKFALLYHLNKNTPGSILVFTRMKHSAKKLARELQDRGVSATEIHSNRTQAQRMAALKGFKSGQHKVLVATDIASRGIHVDNIELVVNFDLPEQTSDYVHRIGRTGRAGKKGHAVSFVTSEQKRDLRDIERLIKRPLKVLPMPKMEPMPAAKPRPEPTEGGHGHGRRFGGHGAGGPRRRSGGSGFGGHRRGPGGGGGRGHGGGSGRGPSSGGHRSRRPGSSQGGSSSHRSHGSSTSHSHKKG